MKKRILTAMLTMAMFAACVPGYASSSAVRVDTDSVPLDGSAFVQELKVDEYAYSPLELDHDGRLSVSVTTAYDSLCYIYLYTQDYEVVDYESIHGKGAASPINTRFTFDLDAGLYYVCVQSWNGVSGEYTIKADYTPVIWETEQEEVEAEGEIAEESDTAANTMKAEMVETEDNDRFDTANVYEPNSLMKGFLASASGSTGSTPDSLDHEDYYVMTLSEEENFSIRTYTLEPISDVVNTAGFYFAIYSEDRSSLMHTYDGDDYDGSITLGAGTYYLQMCSLNDKAGRYAIRLSSGGQA